MKIIEAGETCKRTCRFTCKNCGCIFEAEGDETIGGAICKRHLSVAKVANVSNAVGVELGATATTTSMEQTQAGAPIARCMRVARNWPQ